MGLSVRAFTRQNIVAIAIGVLVAGAPLIAFNFWLSGVIDRQGQAETESAARRMIALGESRVGEVMRALDDLALRGVTACVPGNSEAMQSAVAAGLLGVGGTFIGTMEGAATLIDEILSSTLGPAQQALVIAKRMKAAGQQVPGFGHPFHRPDDPRSPRLFEVAGEAGVQGDHIAALKHLSSAVDEVWGKHLTINATGAVAAVLGEIGIPQKIMRGLAVVSRSAGLVGHIHEEQSIPTARRIWDITSEHIPYESES